MEQKIEKEEKQEPVAKLKVKKGSSKSKSSKKSPDKKASTRNSVKQTTESMSDLEIKKVGTSPPSDEINHSEK